ncbi:MAG: BlaI/MecI/CopY family transcriptional regulator [Planctomycetia bacterium]|nr:BlaI/MecI/CopY family transcriptional regulator [Planctomycetia bacterium]
MARTPQDITDAELAVLEALWERGPATIRQLTDALYPDGGAAQYATVQKLLERLEAKGGVRRNRQAAVHVFAAVLDREQLIGRRLRAMADQLCGGSLTPLLTHLVQTTKLSPEQRQELRALIESADRPTRKERS